MKKNAIAASLFVLFFVIHIWTRATYETREIMPWLYSSLVALTIILAFLRAGNLYAQALLSARWGDVAYLILTGISFAVLAMTTGPAPYISIDLIRPYLVDMRFFIFDLTVVILVFETFFLYARLDIKK